MFAFRPTRLRALHALALIPLVAGGCYDGLGSRAPQDTGLTSGLGGRDTEADTEDSSADASGSGGDRPVGDMADALSPFKRDAWQKLSPAERLDRSWKLRERIPDPVAVHDRKLFPKP